MEIVESDLPEMVLSWSPPLRHTISDPIYGPVRVSQDELKIIDHILFRRLHRIRQNGLLYLIFPSATHTRFEHSLGALHVVELILQYLLFNSYVAAQKTPPSVISPERAEDGQAIDFRELSFDQLKFVFKTARLAALVHDIGHGPLSHYFDPFAPKNSKIAEIINDSVELNSLRYLIRSKHLDVRNNARVKHEVMSCILFCYLWGQIGGDTSIIGDVAAAVLGDPNLCSIQENKPFIPLISDIMASAPADADRMDYLERDSRSIGVTYGLYDRGRLLKSILPYKVKIKDGSEIFRLGFKYSGLRAVENFIQARFQLYIQIYYHKTNRAIQRMLQKISDNVSEDLSVFPIDNLEDLINLYIELSDERFIQVLRGVDKIWSLENSSINEIAKDIYYRKIWKRVYEAQNYTQAEYVFDELKKLNLSNNLILDNIKSGATKGLKKGAALLRRGEDDVYKVEKTLSWLKSSPIIKALEKEETNIGRIYLSDLEASNITELREKAKEIANSIKTRKPKK